VMQEVLMFR